MVLSRDDLRSSHEEADVILVNQLIAVQDTLKYSVVVISGDTDVFVLLLSNVKKYEFKFKVLMESPIRNLYIIDISNSTEKHSDIVFRSPSCSRFWM